MITLNLRRQSPAEVVQVLKESGEEPIEVFGLEDKLILAGWLEDMIAYSTRLIRLAGGKC